MHNQHDQFSPADLSTAGIRIQPSDAVAISLAVIERVRSGQATGIPTADNLRFHTSGDILTSEDASASTVQAAARLLDALLPDFSDHTCRVPGALRIVIARALGTLDLPPYDSLESFAAALARFSAPDARHAVRALGVAWAASRLRVAAGAASTAVERPPLTISDVRRARRSTGLTLSDISDRSRIPVSLLRELEWGYFVNWPAGHYGRTQLIRYARAAGLDDEVVMRAVWPVLQEAIRARSAPAQAFDVSSRVVPTVETTVVTVPAERLAAHRPDGRRGRALAFAAAALTLLLGVASIPMLLDRGAPPVPTQEAGTAEPPAVASAPAATPAAAPALPEPPPPAADPDIRPAPTVASTPPQRPGREQVPAFESAAARPQPAALDAAAAFSPTFATTGSAMFYHADGTEGSALMKAETGVDGAILRVTSIVDDRARNFHARPSPDGQMIAFDSDREGERAVYVADADGGSVRRVSGEGFAAVPSWSPDGRLLAFVRSEPDRPRVWNIWTVDLATGETRRLTSHKVGQPWGAAWFPDGTRIAYSHEDRLVVRSLDGTYQRIYPSPKKGRLVRTPAVAPDGKQIIFQLYRDGAWMLDLADGSMRRILTDPTAEEFTWSPDGRRVAYHSRQTGDWNVWMMAAR